MMRCDCRCIPSATARAERKERVSGTHRCAALLRSDEAERLVDDALHLARVELGEAVLRLAALLRLLGELLERVDEVAAG